MSPRSNKKPSFGQRSTLEKHVTSMSCRLEPAIWSHDTGQQIPYFDRCQLIITWMSDIKEVHGKPRLHASVNLLLEYGRHVARLHRRRQGGKRPGGETGSPLLGQCVMRRRTGTSAPSALPVQLMAAKNLLSTNRK